MGNSGDYFHFSPEFVLAQALQLSIKSHTESFLLVRSVSIIETCVYLFVALSAVELEFIISKICARRLQKQISHSITI